ncbi:MAG TPA: ABC transporter permease [Gemmatimonadales bacterium]|jgi:peptide/nickel transport system permease protein|nr:ABC transporter permease [Gemmatimonadales bacterium]
MLASMFVRFVRGIAVIVGVLALTFVLLHASPGDPVRRLLGPSATAGQVAAQRQLLGLDRPLPVQFADWARAFVRGDWGRSIGTGEPVLRMIARAWPRTVELAGISLLLSYLIGIIIGTIQAACNRTRLDTGLSVATVTLFAMPSYWLGLMLVMLFAYALRWLPAFGATGLDADFLSPGARVIDSLRHLALPLTTLTLIGIAGTARFVRAAMLDVQGEAFVTVAAAKGISGRRVRFHHVLRNALVPVVTLLGLSLPALFSGAVFVEAIFAWPGVGRVLVEAVQARDYPVVMAATAVSAILVVTGNLLAEWLAALTDPRLREASHA